MTWLVVTRRITQQAFMLHEPSRALANSMAMSNDLDVAEAFNLNPSLRKGSNKPIPMASLRRSLSRRRRLRMTSL